VRLPRGAAGLPERTLTAGVAARQEKLAVSPPPPAQILEEVPKARRVCLEYEHVSAWVPATAASSGLLPDLRWLCARRGARTADRGCSDSDSDGAADGKAGKHRQVSCRGVPLPLLSAASFASPHCTRSVCLLWLGRKVSCRGDVRALAGSAWRTFNDRNLEL